MREREKCRRSKTGGWNLQKSQRGPTLAAVSKQMYVYAAGVGSEYSFGYLKFVSNTNRLILPSILKGIMYSTSSFIIHDCWRWKPSKINKQCLKNCITFWSFRKVLTGFKIKSWGIINRDTEPIRVKNRKRVSWPYKNYYYFQQR